MKEGSEFIDESAQSHGHPAPGVDMAKIGPQIDQAEIDRRIEAGGGRPLADILRDLERR